MGIQMFSSYTFMILVLFFSDVMFCINNLPFVSGQYCVQNQNDLLLEFKNNLTYDPSLSTKLVQWNESIDCCQWGGVKCDSRGRVTGLDLSWESISGGIDDNATTLFKLEFFQSLNLAYNIHDSAQLPSGFGRLTSLTYLNLSYCNYSGQIPQELSNLTRLVVLDLSNSYSLNLKSPDLKTLLQNFTQLRELYLDGVNISANGYQWCNAVSSSLPNLRVLSLSYTYITGPFDSSLVKLQFLSVIHLDDNDFSSPFPDFFTDFPSLSVLTLSYCNLSGVIPGKLFQITSLQTVDLRQNPFLEGSLAEFALNWSLQNLFIGGTKFSGNVHESIGNLKKLSRVDLRGCCFSGSIPNSIRNLNHLIKLDLSFNRFTGSVDLTDFRNLSNLMLLDLSYNNLSVSINQNISVSSFLPHLTSLALASCNLQNVPLLKNHSSLVNLDLSKNKLNGEIPNWIWETGNGTLRSLNLSHNQFTSLQEPYDIRGGMWHIDLHSNMLAGKIPVLPPFIEIVDFSNNNFSSSLPEDFVNSQYLAFFSIANNNIIGTIPPSLCNQSDLFSAFIDLSNNRFHGRIPSCLVGKTLGVLNLGRNNLSGDIPDMFPVNCALGTLDLSWNDLQGQIPMSLSRCSKIQVLNLGYNHLNDTFPCSFKSLSELRVLELHSNKFHGNINCLQEDNYTWANLQIIDLASNNFNGVLPEKLFHNMKALMVDGNGTRSQLRL